MIHKKDQPERMPLSVFENTALVAAIVAMPLLLHPRGGDLALLLLAFAVLVAGAAVAGGVLYQSRTLGRRLCLLAALALALYLTLLLRGDWPEGVRDLLPGFLREAI